MSLVSSVIRFVLGLCVFGLLSSVPAYAVVDGNTYTVIAPTYRAASGAETYVRFFNGGSAASTFTVRVVGSPSGNTYGTTTYQVSAKAEIQRALSVILTNSNSGALANGDTGYSLYLQNPDATAGYQHVIFSTVTLLFENASICKTPLNQALAAVSNNAALIAVHTSAVANNAYPSTVYFHNYRPIPIAYQVTVVDAVTGTTICRPGTTGSCAVSVEVAANETRALSFVNFFQTQLSWTPTTAQPHANLFITDPSQDAPPSVLVSQAIFNNAGNGNVDLSNACSVNPAANVSNPIATASASIFDGTLTGSSSAQSGTFTVTIAGSGTSGSPAPQTAAFEKSQSIERPQASLTATGALRLFGTSTNITLTGTYNTVTSALTLSGSGYSFSGSTTGASSVSGSYTGPGSVSGGFAAVAATAATKATTYCGTYVGGGGAETGRFNLVFASNGKISGSYQPSDDPGGTLSGSTTSTTAFTAVTNGGTNVTGTYSAGGTSGTYLATDGETGTFTGATCAVPR